MSMSTATPSLKAVIYLRVSSEKQTKTDADSDIGFSIKAQGEACRRRARELGAMVVGEYVDLGESAKSRDRTQFQAMVDAVVTAGDIDYVIVHKLDRFARNRVDDALMTLQLQEAGAQLVSCTEAIDGTPSGSLLHGIMAAIAEFYSKNLASEVKKGFEQKAKAGGTPTRAKLGYLNARKTIDGRNVGVVIKDPERGPLIKLAFQMYATGDFSYSQLCDILTAKGLRTRPTSRHNGKPLTTSQLDRILKDRYYLGKVVYEGVEYPGKHPALIDEDLYARVQDVIKSHSVSGDKRRLHHHYLKGSIYCGNCGKRLIYTKARNRHGTIYDYFYCVGRQHYGKSCTQGWMSANAVAAAVERHYSVVNQLMTPERAQRIRASVNEHVEALQRTSKLQAAKHQQAITSIETEQLRLVQAHGAGAVPLNILKKEQARLARELHDAGTALKLLRQNHAGTKRTIELAVALVADCQAAYANAPDRVRRLLNQAIFDRIWIEGGEVNASTLTPPFSSLLDPALASSHDPPAASTSGIKTVEAPERAPGAFSYIPTARTAQTAVLAAQAGPQPPFIARDGVDDSALVGRPATVGAGSKNGGIAERAGFEPSEGGFPP